MFKNTDIQCRGSHTSFQEHVYCGSTPNLWIHVVISSDMEIAPLATILLAAAVPTLPLAFSSCLLTKHRCFVANTCLLDTQVPLEGPNWFKII